MAARSRPRGAAWWTSRWNRRWQRWLHTAAALGCVREVAVIVSSAFFRPRDREGEADAVREKFFVPESDHLTMLNVYTQWQRNGSAAGGRRRGAVQRPLYPPKGAEKGGGGAGAAAGHYAAAPHRGELRGGGLGRRALFGLGYTPPYVVHHELTLTTKEYMSCVTSVEPQWLAELGPAFFGLRGAGGDGGGGGGGWLEAL